MRDDPVKEETKKIVIAHGLSEYPREACGLLIIRKGRETYCPCRNIAIGTDNFALHPDDYSSSESEGEIVGIIHTHPNMLPIPSQADLVACEASGLTWHIVGIPTELWQSISPSGYKAPLVGREWSHGVLDCYSIVRDYYDIEKCISLPNFERRDEWWLNGENLYVENFSKAGFSEIERRDILVGDVILIQTVGHVPNHAAIYLGDGLILHHIQNRLSSRDVYGGYYQKHTTHFLRYHDGDSAASGGLGK